MQDWKHSVSLGASINNSGKKALDPKEMPTKYYQGVPAFMRSEGPYTTYNHHKVKGEEFYENSKLTKS